MNTVNALEPWRRKLLKIEREANAEVDEEIKREATSPLHAGSKGDMKCLAKKTL